MDSIDEGMSMADFYDVLLESWNRPMPCAGYAFPTREWVWKTSAGNGIQIKNMDDQHLQNSVRMLERNGNWRTSDYYYPMLAEIQRRKPKEFKVEF